MIIEYKLNKEARKKFNFDYMVCNGWFGVHPDFNKYKKERKEKGFKFYDEINIVLNDEEIDFVTKNSTCIEY